MDETTLLTGRDLDAEIARRVFGWTWVSGPGPNEGFWSVPPNDPFYTGGGEATESPTYSTDIAAAWHVTEQLQSEAQQGLALVVRRSSPSQVPGWRAGYVVDGHPGTFLIDAAGETAPLAICRAALALAPTSQP